MTIDQPPEDLAELRALLSEVDPGGEIRTSWQLWAQRFLGLVVGLLIALVAYVPTALLVYLVVRDNGTTTRIAFGLCLSLACLVFVAWWSRSDYLRVKTAQIDELVALREVRIASVLAPQRRAEYIGAIEAHVGEVVLASVFVRATSSHAPDLRLPTPAFICATRNGLETWFLDADSPTGSSLNDVIGDAYALEYNGPEHGGRPIHLGEGQAAAIGGVFAYPEPGEEAALADVVNVVQEHLILTWSSPGKPYFINLHKPERPANRLVRDAREAELVVAEWVRWLGWPNAAATQYSNDGGVDVKGAGPRGTVAVQVKFEANKAGRPVLQALLGAGAGIGASDCLFFNSAGYSADATVWANAMSIGLFQFTMDGDIEPVNDHATSIFTG